MSVFMYLYIYILVWSKNIKGRKSVWVTFVLVLLSLESIWTNFCGFRRISKGGSILNDKYCFYKIFSDIVQAPIHIFDQEHFKMKTKRKLLHIVYCLVSF